MKKATICLLTLLFASIVTYAQPGMKIADKRKVSVGLGVTAGASFSTFKSSDPTLAPDFTYRPGVNGGLYANFRFIKRNKNSTVDAGVLAVQPEVKFSMMGANSENTKLGLSNLSAGLMIQLYPIRDLYIELGPQIDLNLSHTPDNIAVGNTGLNLDKLKANDVCAAAGLGYKFGGFGIGARYLYGFSSIARNLKWQSSAIQLNLSYSFKLN